MKKFIFMCLLTLFTNVIYSLDLLNSVWIISEEIHFDDVLSGCTRNELIGQKIMYTDKKVHFCNQVYSIKKIITEEWDENDLYSETVGTASRGLTFSDLGITNRESIETFLIKFYEAELPCGANGYVIDKYTIITEYEGSFYLMKRTE